MPPVLAAVSYEPVKAVKVLSSQGNSPQLKRELEAASQTFQIGVPVTLDGSNNLVESIFSAADLVYGFSAEHAHNLTTAGTAQDLSEAAPQNQPSGITTPVGAWIRDGRLGVYVANAQTVFSIALKAGQVFAQSMVGLTFGLTKDSPSGFWYLDNTDTTGNNAVFMVLENDSSAPNTVAGGARVFGQVIASKRVFQ